eukprot:6211836-Pleurochrysis_carterae.AAC.2
MSAQETEDDMKNKASHLVQELLSSEACDEDKHEPAHLRWLQRELLKLLKEKCELQAEREAFFAERNNFYRKAGKRSARQRKEEGSSD